MKNPESTSQDSTFDLRIAPEDIANYAAITQRLAQAAATAVENFYHTANPEGWPYRAELNGIRSIGCQLSNTFTMNNNPLQEECHPLDFAYVQGASGSLSSILDGFWRRNRYSPFDYERDVNQGTPTNDLGRSLAELRYEYRPRLTHPDIRLPAKGTPASSYYRGYNKAMNHFKSALVHCFEDRISGGFEFKLLDENRQQLLVLLNASLFNADGKDVKQRYGAPAGAVFKNLVATEAIQPSTLARNNTLYYVKQRDFMRRYQEI